MEDLKQLREILGRPDLSFQVDWPEQLPKDHPGNVLYRAIENRNSEEEKIRKQLFRTSGSSSAFSNLKNRVRRALICRILMVRPRNKRHNRKEDLFFNTYRTFLVIRFLFFLGARIPAVRLLEKELPRLEKLGDTQRQFTASCWLRHHYGLIEYHPARYRNYRKLARQKLDLLIREARADDLIEELLFLYRKLGVGKPELPLAADAAGRQLKEILPSSPSPLLEHRYWFAEVIARMSRNDYPGTAQTCSRAIQRLNQLKGCPPAFFRTYYFQLIVCHIQTSRFAEAEKALHKLDEYLHEGNSNWFKSMELACILWLRSRQYEKAAKQWQAAVSHSGFKKLYGMDREIWRLLEGYLYYLAGTDLMNGYQNRLPRFRLGRFLNEVPKLSRDKMGYNVNIIILQYLFLIRQRKLDHLIDRSEAVEKYVDRYLRGAAHRRSRFFIKMLLQVPRANYHPVRVKRYIQRWQKKLYDASPIIAREPHEIELVPYETLWETIKA